MIPELGQWCLILALVLALVQSSVPLLGSYLGDQALMRLARPVSIGQCAFIVIAFALLVDAFVNQDFSVAYVAQNSNLDLPMAYRVSAVWGAHEGSLLLWVMILGLWTTAVALFSNSLPLAFRARVLSVLGWISVGFLLFTLFTSNPFLRHLPPLANGNDLNPLLQDPGLIIHPPMLYLGYVGFSVAFAFAVAALLDGRVDQQWVRWSRPRAGSMPPGHAGSGPGPWPPGASSPSASRWAAGGPITSWAGAAGGSGTRWRTLPSCPGWSAPR